MKKIMLCVNPRWVKKILNGQKVIEIRKTIPSCELPCEVYIYCLKDRLYCYKDKIYYGNSNIPNYNHYSVSSEKPFTMKCISGAKSVSEQVVAKFILNNFYEFTPALEMFYGEEKWEEFKKKSLIEEDYTINKYNTYYGWEISNLEIFEKPRRLIDYGIKATPKGWCYIKGDD